MEIGLLNVILLQRDRSISSTDVYDKLLIANFTEEVLVKSDTLLFEKYTRF